MHYDAHQFRLKTAQEELDLVTSQLKEKQDKLAVIESKVSKLYCMYVCNLCSSCFYYSMLPVNS